MMDKVVQFLLMFSVLSSTLVAESFSVEGSDLLMGIGAENIATASAKTANTDDVYAIFYNPAGLSEIVSGELSVSSQLDAQLGVVNFVGLAYAFELKEINLKVAVAFAFIPRLYVKSSGEYTKEEFESLFLRFTLPELSANFNGDIASKTDDYRFGIAISALNSPSWSVGLSVGYINCATTFAGVALEDPQNFTYMSTVAKATAFGVGAKYYADESLTFGVNLRNIDAKLTVEVHTIDDNGDSYKNYDIDFPYDFSVGADWKYTQDINFAADYQQIFGAYGGYNLDFKLLRLGTSIEDDTFTYHFGSIVPLVIKSSELGKIKLPAPFMPTFGFGWHRGAIHLSSAFYIHPIMTLHLGRVSPSLDLSVSYRF